ncbi:MAG TPA: tetratricopeptide repeat protein [Candidatus Limnocylindria bacterium]|jgi:tetratricopeptide (TPR) repeat protein|nr:tetratricopeptide repeat protein [Candidatus Limnocylindria bacterium]
MRRALLTLVVTCCAMTAVARAELYPHASPPPRTTDPAALADQARAREIHERFARGIAAQEAGDWAGAEPEFRRIIVLDPPEPRGSTARYDLALSEAQLGRYASAAELLTDALRRDPHFAAAAANLVTVELQRGDVAAARAAADRFAAIAPEAALAHYGRGLAALRAGDLATARADFRALADTNPAYAVAHYDLALVELRAGHDDAALAELTRALALSPGYARARFALGTVLLRDGRRDDARVAFDRCAHDAADPALRALAIDLRDKL